MTFCMECGAEIGETVKFCGKCGNKVAGPGKPALPAPDFESIKGSFVKAVSTCLHKYVDFKGRAAREEFWYFFAAIILLTAIVGLVIGSNLLASLLHLAVALPSWCAATRRLHDTNRSGWWQLIVVTVIGIIPLFIWLAAKGDDDRNRYGDPV